MYLTNSDRTSVSAFWNSIDNKRPCVLISLFFFVISGSLLMGQDFQIRTRLDLVVVPVSVQDRDGSQVGNLKQDDFTVLEDGRPQTITNFSTDSPPLSVAIVVDTGMCGPDLHRFMNVKRALFRGFRAGDEIAVYRYDHLATKLSDFTKDLNTSEASLDAVRQIADTKSSECPRGTSLGPSPLRWALDRTQIGSNGAPSTPDRATPTQPNTATRSTPSSRVLHDAVFAAATDLSKRTKDNRKILILISDGQVAGSNDHTEGEASEQLVRSGIQVYGVRTDTKIFEHMTALNSYGRSSGGAMFDGGSEDNMGLSMGKLVDRAHDQYVLGYVSDNEVSSGHPVFRKIEVKTRDSKLKLTFRPGYLKYP
jgi:Ca-activated chloride channel family protein